MPITKGTEKGSEREYPNPFGSLLLYMGGLRLPRDRHSNFNSLRELGPDLRASKTDNYNYMSSDYTVFFSLFFLFDEKKKNQ